MSARESRAPSRVTSARISHYLSSIEEDDLPSSSNLFLYSDHEQSDSSKTITHRQQKISHKGEQLENKLKKDTSHQRSETWSASGKREGKRSRALRELKAKESRTSVNRGLFKNISGFLVGSLHEDTLVKQSKSKTGSLLEEKTLKRSKSRTSTLNERGTLKLSKSKTSIRHGETTPIHSKSQLSSLSEETTPKHSKSQFSSLAEETMTKHSKSQLSSLQEETMPKQRKSQFSSVAEETMPKHSKSQLSSLQETMPKQSKSQLSSLLEEIIPKHRKFRSSALRKETSKHSKSRSSALPEETPPKPSKFKSSGLNEEAMPKQSKSQSGTIHEETTSKLGKSRFSALHEEITPKYSKSQSGSLEEETILKHSKCLSDSLQEEEMAKQSKSQSGFLDDETTMKHSRSRPGPLHGEATLKQDKSRTDYQHEEATSKQSKLRTGSLEGEMRLRRNKAFYRPASLDEIKHHHKVILGTESMDKKEESPPKAANHTNKVSEHKGGTSQLSLKTNVSHTQRLNSRTASLISMSSQTEQEAALGPVPSNTMNLESEDDKRLMRKCSKSTSNSCYSPYQEFDGLEKQMKPQLLPTPHHNLTHSISLPTAHRAPTRTRSLWTFIYSMINSLPSISTRKNKATQTDLSFLKEASKAGGSKAEISNSKSSQVRRSSKPLTEAVSQQSIDQEVQQEEPSLVPRESLFSPLSLQKAASDAARETEEREPQQQTQSHDEIKPSSSESKEG